MDIINIIPALIAISGFPIGILLSKISPEEMDSGRKYFLLLKSLMLSFIGFFLLYAIRINLIIAILTSVIIFLITLYIRINPLFFYPFFVLIIYLTINNNALLSIQYSLIFLFGLPAGSCFFKTKKLNKKHIRNKTHK